MTDLDALVARLRGLGDRLGGGQKPDWIADALCCIDASDALLAARDAKSADAVATAALYAALLALREEMAEEEAGSTLALRAANEQRDRAYAMQEKAFAEYEAEKSRLRGELAEARKDTARLDKAERFLARGNDIIGCDTAPSKVALENGFLLEWQPTLRAALDACPEPGGQDAPSL